MQSPVVKGGNGRAVVLTVTAVARAAMAGNAVRVLGAVAHVVTAAAAATAGHAGNAMTAGLGATGAVPVPVGVPSVAPPAGNEVRARMAVVAATWGRGRVANGTRDARTALAHRGRVSTDGRCRAARPAHRRRTGPWTRRSTRT